MPKLGIDNFQTYHQSIYRTFIEIQGLCLLKRYIKYCPINLYKTFEVLMTCREWVVYHIVENLEAYVIYTLCLKYEFVLFV